MALRWGIASAGAISHDFVSAVQLLPAEDHQIVAVGARGMERASAFADKHKIPQAYGSYEDLAHDVNVDVVYIGSIHPEHVKLCILFLNARKRVLCEKPLTLSLRDTQLVLTTAKEKKLFLMEGIWSRCFPIYDHLKNHLAENRIGNVVALRASFGIACKDVERIMEKELGGGATMDLGIYPIQFANWVFGETPQRVVAAGHLTSTGVDESASITLLYSNNRIAQLFTSVAVPLDNEAVVYGTNGTITIIPVQHPTKMTIHQYLPNGVITLEDPEMDSAVSFNYTNGAGMRYEAEHVRKCVNEGLLESDIMPHKESEAIAKILEDVVQAIGVYY
ncbi:PREDICTED: trans-1,2-dihydrobenzene-1,2-diol dehydrogenase-like [Priapulus caudatus]|uniref:Trans-1,2-dihydrobenzene-1,2-diol dehydrogenase n=1 Tax=Priapulus caudatus TaxID=37621 RepID=A0ABM1FAK8_PRICU|nr:PREDICTED: trans-1,2-dihydrobenzene-1,2-diol dehydrogenase-like [Priapulus caudatus]